MEWMGIAMAVGGLVITIVVVGVTGLLLWRIFGGLSKANAERDRLLRDGLRARARVQNVQMGGMTMTVGVHRHLQLQIALQVEPEGRPAYGATLTTLVSELQIPQIQPGALLTVRYDPNDPSKLALEGVGAPQGPGGSAPAAAGAPGFGAPPGGPGYGAPGYGQGAPVGYGGGSLAAYGGGHGAPGMVPIASVPKMPTGAKIGLIVGGLGALVGIGVAVVVVAVNVFGVGLGSVAGGSSGGESGGGVCDRAARCCETIGGPAAACNNLKKIGVPDSACESALSGYRQAAAAQGKQCN